MSEGKACVKNGGAYLSVRTVIQIVAMVAGALLVWGDLVRRLDKIETTLSVRTMDRWTCTDDAMFMSQFAWKNQLVMPDHARATKDAPE